MSEPMLLTIADVQQATQLGRTKLYELMRDGELPFIRIGRSVRIRREDFEAWLVALEEQTRIVDLPAAWR
jgi:excisionase family DNA binding protein